MALALPPILLVEPRERSGCVQVDRLGRLAPGRDLPDERHPGVQLAHPVDELLADRHARSTALDPPHILRPRQPPVPRLAGTRRSDSPSALVVELAHPIDQAALLGLGRRQRLDHAVLTRPLEELREPAIGLEIAADHDRVVGLERLGDPVDERSREPQRVADLADGRPRPVRHEVADHPRVLGSVAPVDVLDDLLATLAREVDVDVRVGCPALVDEPLEQEVVRDRFDPTDPERVRDDRARGASPALGRDPPLLRVLHQVPADQEELGEPGPLDDPELVGEAVHDGRGQRVVAPLGAGPAQLGEVRERGLAVRDREAREAVLLEPEIDRARRRDLDRVGDALPPGLRRGRVEARPEGGQSLAGLEVRLGVGSAQIRERIERPAVLDRGQHVVQLAVVSSGVVDVVGDDDRERERRRFGHEPVVVGQEMVRELDEEAARRRPVSTTEQRRVALGNGPRTRSIADPQPACDLPIATARQRDETIVVLVEQGVADPGHRLRPREVRARDDPAQAPPAGGVPCQQHEMRPASALADPAQVLLDRIAMAGELRALGPWPRGTALENRRLRGSRPIAAPTPLAAGRDDYAGRIGDGRIEQVELGPDHAVQAGFLGRAHEPDRPVQPVAVRDGQPGQAQLHGPIDQLVRGRGAVEEREIGMRVEFGVRGARHRGRSVGSVEGGLISLEHLFYAVS